MTTTSVEFSDQGPRDGRTFLLLHGGAGPMSMAGFARLLAGTGARVITPTHPGFNGTARVEGVESVRDLARVYDGLLDELDLHDVTVVGNSVGGWITAELGLLGSRRVSALIVIDAVGIEVPGHPVADLSGLSLPEITKLSWADPARFSIDPAASPAAMAANFQTLRSYAGDMVDPTLRDRLTGLETPTLVVWGEADGIAGPGYGRAFAELIPGAEFVLLPDTGHLPQLESPQRLLPVVQDFAGRRQAA